MVNVRCMPSAALAGGQHGLCFVCVMSCICMIKPFCDRIGTETACGLCHTFAWRLLTESAYVLTHKAGQW